MSKGAPTPGEDCVLRRLVQKEFLDHLLDLRFVFVSVVCILLMALSVHVGIRSYVRQLDEYRAVTESNRQTLQTTIDKGSVYHLEWTGYRWRRPPEVLSPLVQGLSGVLGREVGVNTKRLPLFESSSAETDPVHALFEVLDLSYIVIVVLSLVVILFTHDAVCGEKEAGTLRLYASFPVARSTLALAKLLGSTLSVITPFIVASVACAAVMSLSPEVGLRGEDWARMVVLLVVYILYLTVFAAFGVCVSSLSHRRMTAFLGLLGLWTVWLFILPNTAVDVSLQSVSTPSVYELQRQGDELREKGMAADKAEMLAFVLSHKVDTFKDLPDARKKELAALFQRTQQEITSRQARQYFQGLKNMQGDRRNRTWNQQRLAMALSAISPVGGLSVAAMDLARTGAFRQERIEDQLYTHLDDLARYIREVTGRSKGSAYYGTGEQKLEAFPMFEFRDSDTLEACLSRNAIPVLNLVLLAVLGYVCAYVAILRYDVR